jgi:2-polyprenyl-3-methyl-5-hydroxy-6-metoxy-1,4-benzoquinol methylase
VDQGTLDAYRDHAEQVAKSLNAVPSPLQQYFSVAFPRAGMRILDVGAGAGRELAVLLGERFDAWGIEPVAELRRAALELHPQLSDRLTAGQLPGLTFGQKFDGLVCCAVLQHIPRAQLFEAVLDLRGALSPGGRALVSIPTARSDVGADNRDPMGRLFNGVTVDELQLLFERVGFSALSRWSNDDLKGRPGTRWATLLFEVADDASGRAIDRSAG